MATVARKVNDVAAGNFLYELYERRLAAQIDPQQVPKHVGVILDGNRRWAKLMGLGTQAGHKRGADKIEDFLGWAQDAGVKVVTLWLLSTDNLSRDPQELSALLNIIVQTVESLSACKRWNLRLVGAADLLPAPLVSRLRAAVNTKPAVPQASATHMNTDKPMEVNIAVGYGGRQEIAAAVRAVLREQAAAGATLAQVAQNLQEADITEHLYTKGQPDPELVIRTSGEQRLSGFLLWQSVHSEYYFCEAYWPDFRRIDFLRALRDYSRRERRLGR